MELHLKDPIWINYEEHYSPITNWRPVQPWISAFMCWTLLDPSRPVKSWDGLYFLLSFKLIFNSLHCDFFKLWFLKKATSSN